jgi:hypothetical protein
MRSAKKDPKRGAQKVTNTDEQEVVVNHSTSQEGGFDEPVNQQEEEIKEEVTSVKAQSTPERIPSGRPKPGDDSKRKYHEEETE